jgi:hypothetical protein
MNTDAKKRARKKWSENHPDYREQYKASGLRKGSDARYYKTNKGAINEKRRDQYQTNADARQTIIGRSRDYYAANTEKVLAANKARLLKRREKIAAIALHYGCQNPDCQWEGAFIPAQLQFHHLVPGEKEYNVSAMAGMTQKRIATEINKCCVLCACCHIAIRTGDLIYQGVPCHVNEDLDIV